MADVSITASAVVPGSGAKIERGTAGAAIAAGELVYQDAAANNTFKLADADSATSGVRQLYGMALNSAAAGQPLAVQYGGAVTMNAALTAGEIYVLSSTAGKMAPEGDLSTGEYVGIVGVALSATSLQLHIGNFAVAIA